MIKYGLIIENNKELRDYIDILNKISTRKEIFVKIVLLYNVYKDNSQISLLDNIHFKFETINIKGDSDNPFVKLSIISKIKIVLLNRKKIFDFLKDVNVVLSGVQTIFERVLYSQFKKDSSIKDTKFIIYHRHLLFDDKVGTLKSWKNSKIVKLLMKFIGLDGFFIDTKAVGFADYYIVLGKINKQYLISKGVHADIIHALGSLEYDNLNDLNLNSKHHTKKQSICYVTGACEWIGDIMGEQYQHNKIINFCEFFKNKLDTYTVWIRVHPRENLEKYENLQKRYPFIRLQITSSNPLLVDLNTFDILIGGTSTTLFEAGLLKNKKILFFIENDELYRYSELLNTNDIKYITNIDDYENRFNHSSDILKIEAISYLPNKSAIDRIANFIERIYE